MFPNGTGGLLLVFVLVGEQTVLLEVRLDLLVGDFPEAVLDGHRGEADPLRREPVVVDGGERLEASPVPPSRSRSSL